jgi:predicted transcriptional regulator
MKRSKLSIYMDILRLIQNEGGRAKPTRILYGANLSYTALKEYLDLLMSIGLIEKVSEKGHDFFKLTKKGYEFINKFREIKRLTEAFGLTV